MTHPQISPENTQHTVNHKECEDWCVYLIQCTNNALYCGISNKPAERFAAHCKGKGARYTKMHPPQHMRLIQTHLSRSHALQIEHQIKQLNRLEKLSLWQASQPFASNTHTIE